MATPSRPLNRYALSDPPRPQLQLTQKAWTWLGCIAFSAVIWVAIIKLGLEMF